MNLWTASIATAASAVVMQAQASTWSIATDDHTSFEAMTSVAAQPPDPGLLSGAPDDHACAADVGEPIRCFALRSDSESLATEPVVAESQPSTYASMLAGLAALGLLGLRSR